MMPRTLRRLRPTEETVLEVVDCRCLACRRPMPRAWDNFRMIESVGHRTRYRLRIRACSDRACSRFRVPVRPEAEGFLALPKHEYGFDVQATVGALRHREHRTVAEIHAHLVSKGVQISERSVCDQLYRYEELVAVSLADSSRLRAALNAQGRVILAIDGLQPHVGHEILWVIRDTLSGEPLLARSLLSATTEDLAGLLGEVAKVLPVPVAAVLSDGQSTIRRAVKQALPGVPHQLCHFHYLREAARPVYEADRNAKKELKKRVRGVREIERAMEKSGAKHAGLVLDYCAAVRSALDDSGLPPLDPPGLKLRRRLLKTAASLKRAEKKGATPARSCNGSEASSREG